MKALVTRSAILLLLVSASVLQVRAQSGPQISSVQWSPLAQGGTQCINGSGFGSSIATVLVNGAALSSGDINSWTSTQVCAALLEIGTGTANLQISNGAGTSNTASFSVVAAPTISSVHPVSAGAGSQVTITGTGFGSQQGSVFITQGGARPTLGIVNWSDTQVVGTVPTGIALGTYRMYVTAQGLTVNATSSFQVIAVPQISSVQWSPLAQGGTQCINGSGFGSSIATVLVKGAALSSGDIYNWTDTQVCAALLEIGTGTANLQISNGAGTSNTVSFSVVAAPTISSVHPISAGAGSQVTITGTGFGSQQGSIFITQGGARPTLGIVSWSDTQVVGTVPTGVASGTYQMYTTAQGLTVNVTSSFQVVGGPTISAVSPSSGLVGTQVTITGSRFGTTQSSGTVAIGNTNALIVSWSDSQVVAVVASGTTTGNVVVQQGGAQSNGVNFTVSSGPLLRLSISDAPPQVNLSSQQNLDWVHWGRISLTTPDRKSGGTPLISDYTPVTGSQIFSSDGAVNYSWTDGNQQAAVAGTNADLQTGGTGGFQITVPADTTVKTLNLYALVLAGQAQLQASLSDGSVPAVTDQSVSDLDISSKIYSIDYRAASAGQTLTVTLIGMGGSTFVGLEAATLTPHLPVVSVSSPTTAESFPALASVPLNAIAYQYNNSISDVKFSGSDGSVLDRPNAPYTATWGPLNPGHYSVSAAATDSTGLFNNSAPVEIDSIGSGGSLALQVAAAPSSANLTTQGTTDWVLWGSTNPASDPASAVLDRKVGVTPSISNYTPIGNHLIYDANDGNTPPAFTYSDGSLSNSAFTGNMLYVFGQNDGYQLTVPADTNQRTLQLYTGINFGQAKITAFLSDGSAAAVSDDSLTSTVPSPAAGNYNNGLYTIRYSAAAAGQTLTVRFALEQSYAAPFGSAQLPSGELYLMAAALSGPPPVPLAPKITGIQPANGATGTSFTITGSGFGNVQNDSALTLDGSPATIRSWSDSQIIATVPSVTPGVYPVTIYGTAGPQFTVSPVITALSSSAGSISSSVTISGLGFGGAQGAGTVAFNGVSASVVSWGDGAITALVPPGATSGSVVVTTASGSLSNGIGFLIIPTISSLSPSTGVVGSAVTINGSGFGQAVGSVTFSGVAAVVTSWSNAAITAVVPHGATSGSVVLTTSSATSSNGLNFSVTPGALMTTARLLHTATLLNDGTVLIAGGFNLGLGFGLATTEVYNPSAGTFTAGGSLITGRRNHTATLLNNGTVLITGGANGTANSLAAAELYDPIAQASSSTGSMTTPRNFHRATLLVNGTVLLAGGFDNSGNTLGSAELYNPATGVFNATGSLSNPRTFQSGTLLNNGQVLIAGGYDSNGNVLASAEIYDPVAGTFTTTGSLNVARGQHTANLLNGGKVLIVGGFDTGGNVLTSAELYDPVAGSFSTTGSPNTPRDRNTATLLNNGTVVLADGYGSDFNDVSTTETWDPATETFTQGSSLSIARDAHTATLLNDGRVLIVGGEDNNFNPLASAEIYRPNTLAPANLVSVAVNPPNPVVPLATSQRLTATGSSADGSTQTLASVTWTSSNNQMATLTNDATNRGSVFAAGSGSTTVSACAGSVCGSAVITTSSSTTTVLSIVPNTATVTTVSSRQLVATATFADGGTEDVTQIVSWSSASPQLASVSAAGQLSGVAPGNTTVSATLGSTSATATVVVIPAISISPQNPAIALGAREQLSAALNSPNGTSQDVTATATWTSSNPSVATIGSSGVVLGRGRGSAVITAASGGLAASVTLTVGPPAFVGASIIPLRFVLPSGLTQQLALTGIYSDGSRQDLTASATWSSLDSTIANVTSSGLAAAVAAGTTSISATLNGMSFWASLTVTAPGPPSITAMASPAPNANGWNNSNVTVVFTCTPGGAVIASCPGPQVISSEGAGQVVSGTVTDAAGNSASTSVTLNIDKTPPALVVSSPSDGQAFADTSITATGTVSDALSGVATLTCNGTSVTFSGSAFSCNITLTPGVNLVVVRATDMAGNAALTKMHVNLNAPLPAPTSLQISPSAANVVVGETQRFAVADDQGRIRNDATWTLSDTALATITTDSSPLLTGRAPGQVILTATVQGVSAQILVDILGAALTQGMDLWSAPRLSGSSPVQVFQAIAGDNTPDVYALEQGSCYDDSTCDKILRAFTAEGMQMWRRTFSHQGGFWAAPDRFGGVVMQYTSDPTSPISLMVLDGQTGATVWQEDFLPSSPNFTIRANGDIVIAGNRHEGQSEVVVNGVTFVDDLSSQEDGLFLFDGSSGQKTAIPLQQTTTGYATAFSFGTPFVYEYTRPHVQMGPMSSDADGNVYVEYFGINEFTTVPVDGLTQSTFDLRLQLVTVGADNSETEQTLKSDIYADVNPAPAGSIPFPGPAIPDGAGGVVATWTDAPVQGDPNLPLSNGEPEVMIPFMVTHSSPTSSTTYELPSLDSTFGLHQVFLGDQFAILRPVLGESGDGFAVSPAGDKVTHFDFNSGGQFWTAATVQPPDLIFATLQGGLTLLPRFAQGFESLDAQGNAGAAASGFFSGTPWAVGLWTGIDASSGLTSLFAGPGPNLSELAASGFAISSGDRAPTNASADRVVVLLTVSNVYNESPGDIQQDSTIRVKVRNAQSFWFRKTQGRLSLVLDEPITPIKACDPVRFPFGCSGNLLMDISEITNAVGATELVRRFCDPTQKLKCTAKGSQLVFNADENLALGYTPFRGSTSAPTFLNMSAIASGALEDSSTDDSSNHDISHELGHQFQLQHIGWSLPSNLMCTGILPSWLSLGANLCHTHSGGRLGKDQIEDVLKGARQYSNDTAH